MFTTIPGSYNKPAKEPPTYLTSCLWGMQLVSLPQKKAARREDSCLASSGQESWQKKLGVSKKMGGDRKLVSVAFIYICIESVA